MKVDFCLNTHSAGFIILFRNYIASLNEVKKIQHFLSHPHLLTIFTKSSIIDARLSCYSKVNVFLRIALFQFFSQRNLYIGKTIHCKTENDIRKQNWYSQKNIQKIAGRLYIFNIEDIVNIDNIEYLQVLVVRGRFCQLQIPQ